MSFDIFIKVIDNAAHRPPFSGADWFFDEKGDLQVRVSRLSDWRREVTLGIHEAIEAILCKHNGVSQEAVDAFDAEYERTHTSDLNSGDDSAAPYRREHSFATAVERILAAEMGIVWADYYRELDSLHLPERCVRTGNDWDET